MRIHQALRQKGRSASRLLKKVGRTLKVSGTRAAMKVLTTAFREYTPSGWRRSLRISEFDQQHGVDTSGVVRIAAMQIASPNYIYGSYYKASKPDLLLEALQRLGVRYEDFAFVDYGSGKGLALLLAANFPFRSITGIEFARDLHEIAAANIVKLRNSNQRCKAITPVCCDAVEFIPPEDPLVCYFYDPFEPQVTERVISTLTASWERRPRPIVILYHGAGQDSTLRDTREKQEAAIRATGVFQKTDEWGQGTWSVYATVQCGHYSPTDSSSSPSKEKTASLRP